MALTLADLKLHITHAIAGGASTGLPPTGGVAGTIHTQIINQAGRAFCTSHDWNFLMTPPTAVSFSDPIELTAATWTSATKTLTQTGAFTNYTFYSGDTIELTDGTGLTAGEYQIASRTSANAITLTNDCDATDGSTDIEGTLYIRNLALPSNFGSIDNVEPVSGGVVNNVIVVTPGHLSHMRARDLSVVGGTMYAAVVYPAKASATASHVGPVLQVYPPPTAAGDGLHISYRRVWTELSSDTDLADIPLYCESALIEFIVAFANGYDNSGAAQNVSISVLNVGPLLEVVKRGPVYQDAIVNDGGVQGAWGPITNGAAQHSPMMGFSINIRSLAAPS